MSACGPRRLALPGGTGTPVQDVAGPFSSATEHCSSVRTLTAEIALSGRAGRQRLRGTVLAGLAPDAVRLEGVAPFGSPMFILAGEKGTATLLLPRDRRVLTGRAPAEILEALMGVALTPGDLLAAITGCVKSHARPSAGYAFGSDWLRVDLEGGGAAYLRPADAGWRVVAGTHGPIQLEYSNWGGGFPQRVRIRTTGPSSSAIDLRLRSSEMNPTIEPAAFSVVVPPGVSPITLDELRDAGPMGR